MKLLSGGIVLAAVLGVLFLPTQGRGEGNSEAGLPPTGKPPEARPQVEDIFAERGVLTPRGTLVVQPSLEYAHSSVNRVAVEGVGLPALLIGAIDVKRVDRDTLIASLGLRYGLTDRLEAELEVPFVWRRDFTTARPLELDATQDKINNAEGFGLGDLEMALRYQLNRGLDGWPYLVGGVRVKSRTGKGPFEVPLDRATGLQEELPTGSGSWGVEPGLTAIFPSDPAVFFTHVSYLWNFESETALGRIDPGDSVRVSMGMGFAINEKTSFSLGYDHNVVGRSTQNGEPFPGLDVLHLGALLLGAGFRLEEGRSLNLSVAVGVTDDAPDVRVALRLPISWSLSK